MINYESIKTIDYTFLKFAQIGKKSCFIVCLFSKFHFQEKLKNCNLTVILVKVMSSKSKSFHIINTREMCDKKERSVHHYFKNELKLMTSIFQDYKQSNYMAN